MPLATDHDADFQGSYFELIMDGLSIGWFTACSGLTLEFEAIKFKEGNGSKIIERKRPGHASYEQIVLKRGFTQNKALYDWFTEVSEADAATPYKTGAINIYDRTQKKVATFNINQAWPSKLSVSDLNSSSDEVMVEELTIEHEFIDWA
jgi:phage tail-like protein